MHSIPCQAITTLCARAPSDGRSLPRLRNHDTAFPFGSGSAVPTVRTTSMFCRGGAMPSARAVLVGKSIGPREGQEDGATMVRPIPTVFDSPAGGANGRDLQSNHRSGMGWNLDYLDLAVKFVEADVGPPRWFRPVQECQHFPAPLLLSLPGIDGTGAELFRQEFLGRLFELRGLHIPIRDRTPFEGLVNLIEEAVREEAALSPGRPIYLVGENFGGALALAVAARNPQLDLVLVLANPCTSFQDSILQPLLPLLDAIPTNMFHASPLLLGLFIRDLSQFTSRKLPSGVPSFQQIADAMQEFALSMPKIANALSKEIVLWKLQLLKSSAEYANSSLHSVKADVLVLASNKDQLFPSLQEARRLTKVLPNCTYRQFEQSSHLVLLEEKFDLATIIKSTGLYRENSLKDPVANFSPPTEEEINRLYDSTRLFRRLVSPVFFSTGEGGDVVAGLSMVPSNGPTIFVGNHTLMGLDMKMISSELLRDRQLLLRALAHPVLFEKELLEEQGNMVEGDLGRLFGAVPATGKNMFKLLARGENVAVYPGGAREALHRKGEAYKLFWPEQPEIVRMAAKFEAPIIPMCSVGEDEIVEVLMDFDEITSIPILGDWLVDRYKRLPQLRSDVEGEVSKQALHMPLIGPKVIPGPGRQYVLFGRPIVTKGKKEYFRDQSNVIAAYHQVQRDVADGLSYLLKMREKDPFRHFVPRITYELQSGGQTQAPSFNP